MSLKKYVNENYHVINFPKSLFRYIKELVPPLVDMKNPKKELVRKTFRVQAKDEFITFIYNHKEEGLGWIKTADLRCLIEVFVEYDISKVDPESFGIAYVEGLFSPFNSKDRTAQIAGNYYELHVQFKVI